MHHIIYKTTCLPTGKWYIGMHSSKHETDRYFGSGKLISASLRKYGKNQHTRETLFTAESHEALRKLEEQIVTLELLKDPMCLNLAVGGCGSGNGRVVTLESRAKMSATRTGTSRTQISRERQGASIRGAKHHAAKTWILLSPEGELIRTNAMNEFCTERGLNYFSMRSRAQSHDQRPISRGTATGWCVLASKTTDQSWIE